MTLQELIDRRASYLAAEKKILESQEYQAGQGSTARKNRRADLSEVRTAITDLSIQIDRLQNAAKRTSRVRYIRTL